MTSAASPAAGTLAMMPPAIFALVMATGIVSIASQLHGLTWLARALFGANVVFYGTLWILTAFRIARFPVRVAADLADHGRSVGYFTTVAATCVLGSQALQIAGEWTVAAALWGVGILLWAVITYVVFTLLTVKAVKPPLAKGLNGAWLIAVVAPQSVALLGAQLAEGFGSAAPQILFFCLGLWLGSGMLYIWIISLIFYRYTFLPMSPGDLAPPYWINMGAVAISTLAGVTLVNAAPHSPLLADLLPFLKGFTLFFWATATWWIPMLVILGVWRHVYRRFPLTYDPAYWGAVFPLGMYCVATFQLAHALGLAGLLVIPRVFLVAALAAWSLTMVGLTRALITRPRRPR